MYIVNRVVDFVTFRRSAAVLRMSSRGSRWSGHARVAEDSCLYRFRAAVLSARFRRLSRRRLLVAILICNIVWA